MTLVPVKKLPKKAVRKSYEHCGYKPVRSYLTEFMKMGVKYARVDINAADYVDPVSARQTLVRSIKDGKFPIVVKVRDYDIYLIRTDLEDPDERI